MSWSIGPVIDWLLHEGRHLAAPETLVGELCARVRAAGMPIDRVAFFFGTLHPQYFGIAMHWNGVAVRVLEASYQMAETEEVRNSPARRITEGERVIRRRLERADCPADFPVLEELRAAGISDYVIAEVVFGNGSRNSVSLATRRAGGFTDHDIAEIQRLLHPFGMAMEIHVGRALSRTLLETYLGRSSGKRVLDGQIKRGDGQSIDAVIWFSDLRESTPLSAALGEQRFLELLNDYFLATAGAVLEHGGEVLRFIGDASLAVFPTTGEKASEVCARAVDAALAARARALAANHARRAAGQAPFACGIGLHLGRVHYGNIGTPERLEFSVIGVAANKAARIEALCKETGQDVVLSSTMAAALGARCRSLGRFALRGVAEPEEVFGLC